MTTINCYRTAPQMEQKAAAELADAGIDARVPTLTHWRRHSHHTHRRIAVRVPAAPGYVFASRSLWDAKHVRRKLGVVRREELDALEAQGAVPAPDPTLPAPYLPGEAVRVATGPLAGSSVVVQQVRGRTAIVRGVMMGGERDMAISTLQLERVAHCA